MSETTHENNGHEPDTGFKRLTTEEKELLARTLLANATPDERAVFFKTVDRTGLDPFARQIHAIFRWDKKAGREIMSIQTGIDGFRLIAQRTREYEGQVGPDWCGPDEIWKDVWIKDQPPAAARVGVWRRGFREPIMQPANWASYAQRNRDGSYSNLWGKMPEVMLAKVAEALALRRAFPQELGGLYTTEEMAQADNPPAGATEPARYEQRQPEPQRSAVLPERSEDARPSPYNAPNHSAPAADPPADSAVGAARGKFFAVLSKHLPNLEDLQRQALAAEILDKKAPVLSMSGWIITHWTTVTGVLEKHTANCPGGPECTLWPGIRRRVAEVNGEAAPAEAPAAAPPPAAPVPESSGDRAANRATPPATSKAASTDGDRNCTGAGCGRPLTAGQREVSKRAYGKPLCPKCQQTAPRLVG